VEDSGDWSAFIEAFVIPNLKPSFPANLRSEIVSQTFISVKPSYAWFGHYSLSCMVCQAHFMQKKSPKTREKLSIIVMLF